MLSEKERFVSALLSQEESNKTELKEMRRRVRDLEEFVQSHSLVQITGEGKELTAIGKESF